MEWISVKDRLPEEGMQVITIDIHDRCRTRYAIDYIIMFSGCEEPFIWANRYPNEQDKVTHWMPLQDLPSPIEIGPFDPGPFVKEKE